MKMETHLCCPKQTNCQKCLLQHPKKASRCITVGGGGGNGRHRVRDEIEEVEGRWGHGGLW